MKNLALAATALIFVAGSAQGQSQIVHLSCYQRVTWGYYSYNGTHFPGEAGPRTVEYTIDLARQRWREGGNWEPFERTTPKEIYLISNGTRQLILRRADLQMIEVEPQERHEQDRKGPMVEHGVVVTEGRCRQLPARRGR